MGYKDFTVHNRAFSSRTNVLIGVTVPFHSGEIPREIGTSNPISRLSDNYSIRINNQELNTKWEEFGAPWNANAQNEGGYIRFCRAEAIMPVFPANIELTGEIIPRQNVQPQFQWNPLMDTAINSSGLYMTARFSGAQLTTNAISGRSTGVYVDNLFPLLSFVSPNTNVVEYKQFGLRTIIESNVWLGKEVHYLDQTIPPGGRAVTGLCHVRSWLEIPSLGTEAKYTIVFANDKLNNPTWTNPPGRPAGVYSIYHSSDIRGDFSIAFSGVGSTNIYSEVGFTGSVRGIGNTSDPNTFWLSGFLGQNGHWKLPELDGIGDGQGFGFIGTISVLGQFQAQREALYPIYGLPTYETWSGVGGPEYPWPEGMTPAIYTNLRSLGDSYHSYAINSSWTNDYDNRVNWQIGKGVWGNGLVALYNIIDSGGTGFQVRLGPYPSISYTPLFVGSSTGLQALLYISLRFCTAQYHGYYRLRHLRPIFDPSNRRLVYGHAQTDPSGTRIQVRTPWIHQRAFVYLSWMQVNSASRNTLGRATGSPGGRPIDFGARNNHIDFEGERDEHVGSTPWFHLALLTTDPFFMSFFKQRVHNIGCLVPKYGAAPSNNEGVSYQYYGSEPNSIRSISRSVRSLLQTWYLTNDPEALWLIKNRIHDTYYPVSGLLPADVPGLPGYRDEGLRGVNDQWKVYPGRDPANGKIGYTQKENNPYPCRGGITGGWLARGRPVRVTRSTTCAFPHIGMTGQYGYTYYPVGVTGDWVQPPGPNIGNIEHRSAWQDILLVRVLAQAIKEFSSTDPETVDTARLIGRELLYDAFTYAYYVPPGDPSTWRLGTRYDPQNPESFGPNQPMAHKTLFTQYESANTRGGPNYGGDIVEINGGQTLGGEVNWGYPGYKSYGLFFDPISDPVEYAKASRLHLATHWSYNYDNLNNRFNSYTYVGDWHWTPQGGPPSRQGPTVSFTGDNLTGVIPLTVNFTDTSVGNPTSWSWDFENDGTIDATTQNASHTYSTAGLYTVALYAANAQGASSAIYTNYIHAQSSTAPSITGDFTGTPQSGTAPLTVQFTDQSYGATAITWQWDFQNDGTIDSAVQNPSFVYTNPGTYDVRLIVESAASTGTVIKRNYITVDSPPGTPPVAEFEALTFLPGTTIPGALYGDSVNFIDRSTATPPVTTWLWRAWAGPDPSTAQTSTLQNPAFTFNVPNYYTISLTVTNSAGSDTETKTNYIFISWRSPVAEFAATPLIGTAPLTVQFRDQSQHTQFTNPLYSWFFGDGSSLIGLSSQVGNPAHTYTTSGFYTVTLGIHDEFLRQLGILYSSIRLRPSYIRVDDPNTVNPPVAFFTAAPRVGTVPFNVNFTDTSTPVGQIDTWAWDFGDGGSSTVQNPSYEYTGSGVFDVALTVTNSAGSSALTETAYITGIDPSLGIPNVLYEADIIAGDYPLLSYFVDTTSGNISGRSWDINGTAGHDVSGTNAACIYTEINNAGVDTTLVVTTTSGIMATGSIIDHIKTFAGATSPSSTYMNDYVLYGNFVRQAAKTNIKFNQGTAIHRHLDMLNPGISASGASGVKVFSQTGNTINTIFTFSGMAPKLVDDATLSLFIDAVSGGVSAGDLQIDFYRMPWNMTNPTWSGKAPNIPWGTSGGLMANVDRSANSFGSIIIPTSYTGDILTTNRRVDVDVTNVVSRGIFEKDFSVLATYNSNSARDLDVTFRPQVALNVRSVRLDPITISGTFATIDQNATGTTFAGIIAKSDPFYNDAKKAILQFDIDSNLPHPYDSYEVHSSMLSVPVAQYTGFYPLPVVVRSLRNVLITDVDWINYSGSSAWSFSGATGVNTDIRSTTISPRFTPEITGIFSGQYGHLHYKADYVHYNVTDDLADFLSTSTSRYINYFLTYDRNVLGDVSGLTFYGSTGSRYNPMLTLFATTPIFGEGISTAPLPGQDPPFGISGQTFTIWKATSSGTISTTVVSGKMFDLTGNVVDGGTVEVYQKLYLFNDTNAPLFDVKLGIISKNPYHVFMTKAKSSTDNNSGDIYLRPAGYSDTDFIRAGKPYVSFESVPTATPEGALVPTPEGSYFTTNRLDRLDFGEIDASGSTGFWVKIVIPERVNDDVSGYFHPIIEYKTLSDIISQP